MEITDRMGGFVAVRIIETKNIARFIVTGTTAKIQLKPGSAFLEISAKKNGIYPNISVNKEKAGHIFNIDLQISVKNYTEIKCTPFNKFIAVCKNPLGTEFILGTHRFPLTATKQPVFSKTAAGEMGEMLIFSGKQPDYPYILTQ